MEQGYQDDHQVTAMYRWSHWLTGLNAGPPVGGITAHVDGSSKQRWWWKSPKPWVRTKPYEVRRFRQWPTQYYVSANFVLYGTGEEYGDTFVNPSAVMTIVGQVSPGNAEGDAMNAALKIIAGASWSLPVALAEMDKTVDSIKVAADVFRKGHELISNEPRKRLYRSMRRMLHAHGFGRFIVRLFGTASEAWLAWRYSVMTAVLDAEDAAKACAEVLANTPRQVEKAMAHRVGPITAVSSSTGDGPLRSGNITTLYARTDYSYTTWTEARAWITAVRQYNPLLAVPKAFGLLNLPAAVWEMFPGSFIADWALNLGDYLEAQNALVGWSVVDSGTSVTRRIAGEVAAKGLTSYPWTTDIEFMAEPVKFEASIYNRSGWADPTPVWTPAFRLTTERMLDSIALCRSLSPLRFRF